MCHLATAVMKDVSEGGLASAARKVLEVLPAGIVVQPLHIDAVLASGSGAARPATRPITLAAAKLHTQLTAVEVVPAEVGRGNS